MSRAYGASKARDTFTINAELRAKGVARILEKGANLLVYNYIARAKRAKNVTRNRLTERRVASEGSFKTGTAEAILDRVDMASTRANCAS